MCYWHSKEPPLPFELPPTEYFTGSSHKHRQHAHTTQFSQNSDLKEELIKTRGTTLVEAAPRDTVWGIGLSAKNWKAQHRQHWRGVYE